MKLWQHDRSASLIHVKIAYRKRLKGGGPYMLRKVTQRVNCKRKKLQTGGRVGERYASKQKPHTRGRPVYRRLLNLKQKIFKLKFQKQKNFCIAEKILDYTKIPKKGSQELSRHQSSYHGLKISLKKTGLEKERNKMKQRGLVFYYLFLRIHASCAQLLYSVFLFFALYLLISKLVPLICFLNCFPPILLFCLILVKYFPKGSEIRG